MYWKKSTVAWRQMGRSELTAIQLKWTTKSDEVKKGISNVHVESDAKFDYDSERIQVKNEQN